MEGRVLVVSIVVGFLGLLSVILGFVAEATRIKVSQLLFDGFTCVYPNSPATALGIVALLVIITAQIIISVLTGCICCCKRSSKPSGSNFTAAQICFVVSWITAVIAALCLMLASAFNNSQKTTIYADGYYECYVVKPGVFAAGAIFSLVTVVLGVISYILSNNQGGIATGHPQYPAAGGNPNQAGIPMGQPQHQWGNNPAVPNQGSIPKGPQEYVV
uniref:Uncharacterized protein n=1 Tax=Fagus sylvatica TaxID=28930 RepID=A0A2N9IAC5_FAGSY